MRIVKRSLPLAVLIAVMSLTAHGVSSAADKTPTVGMAANDFELPNLAGGKTTLSKLTAEGPVVLVVLPGYPGYQCPICNAQVAEFVRKGDDFKKAGSQVVFVYPGPADKLKEHAAEFVKEKQFPAHFHFLLDPDYAFTKTYGLRWDAKSETAYPSTFVLDKKRNVLFARVSMTHGGRAKADETLKAIPPK